MARSSNLEPGTHTSSGGDDNHSRRASPRQGACSPASDVTTSCPPSLFRCRISATSRRPITGTAWATRRQGWRRLQRRRQVLPLNNRASSAHHHAVLHREIDTVLFHPAHRRTRSTPSGLRGETRPQGPHTENVPRLGQQPHDHLPESGNVQARRRPAEGRGGSERRSSEARPPRRQSIKSLHVGFKVPGPEQFVCGINSTSAADPSTPASESNPAARPPRSRGARRRAV